MSNEEHSAETKAVIAAFGRNTFEVIRVEKSRKKHVYSIRVPNDPLVQARWRRTINEFLLGTEEAREKKSAAAKKFSWQVDLSKWFFVANGAVRFCWRIMIVAQGSGGVSRGENMLASCATDALREGIEVTSAPLIGRKEFKGENIGGVYSAKEGAKVLSQAIGGKS